MGLVVVVVGVLAEDDGFDGGEGRVAGPGIGKGSGLVLDLLVLGLEVVRWTYQLYTSSAGGKTFFPDSTSFFRNRLSSKNSLLAISLAR